MESSSQEKIQEPSDTPPGLEVKKRGTEGKIKVREGKGLEGKTKVQEEKGLEAKGVEVKKETTQKTGKLKREVFKTGEIEKTPVIVSYEAIERLSINESVEKQKEAWTTFKMALAALFTQAFHQKILEKEELNWENLPSLCGQLFQNKKFLEELDLPEKSGLKHLQEILKNPSFPLYQSLKQEWAVLSGAILRAQPVVDEMLNPPQKDTKKGKEGVLDKIKKHPVQTAVAAFLITAGAYCAYRIGSAILGVVGWGAKIVKGGASLVKGGAKAAGGIYTLFTSQNPLIKWPRRALELALGFFLVGTILKQKKVKSWLKDRGLKVDDSKVYQAVERFSEGEFKESWETLWTGIPEKEREKLVSKGKRKNLEKEFREEIAKV